MTRNICFGNISDDLPVLCTAIPFWLAHLHSEDALVVRRRADKNYPPAEHNRLPDTHYAANPINAGYVTLLK